MVRSKRSRCGEAARTRTRPAMAQAAGSEPMRWTRRRWSDGAAACAVADAPAVAAAAPRARVAMPPVRSLVVRARRRQRSYPHRSIRTVWAIAHARRRGGWHARAPRRRHSPVRSAAAENPASPAALQPLALCYFPASGGGLQSRRPLLRRAAAWRAACRRCQLAHAAAWPVCGSSYFDRGAAAYEERRT